MAGPLFSDANLPEVRVPPGMFWADYLRTLRGEPPKRLALALKALPLPGAFREAAIGARAMIRAQRDTGQSTDYLLAELYRLAVMDDLLLNSPSGEGVGGSFNVAESMNRRLWESLDSPYKAIGYSDLGLLNKTDVKWIVAAWGEPDSHSKACAHHADFWRGAVVEARKKRERETQRRKREYRELLEDLNVSVSARRRQDRSSGRGCVIVLGLILLAIPISRATQSVFKPSTRDQAPSVRQASKRHPQALQDSLLQARQ